MTYNILDTSIKPGCKSDHSIIRICLNVVKSQRRGRSYWKFNNKLLTEKDCPCFNMLKYICEVRVVKFVLEDFKDCFKVNSIVLQNSIPLSERGSGRFL